MGPPGVGKTTLGCRVSDALGLKFLEVADTPAASALKSHDLNQLSDFIAERAANVIELPWHLQKERKTRAWVSRSGVPLVLWAHPEEMQARSGRKEPLFTPVPRLTTRGGFGSQGTGCREFRHLDRVYGNALLLVGLPFAEAARAVEQRIAELREASDASPAEREGLTGWVHFWCQDYDASPRAAQVIVDAMARYLEYRRSQGASARALSGILSDLNAAGHLVFGYDSPREKRALKYFTSPPWLRQFERKFTDSPTLVTRYQRNLEGFAVFLKESE